MTEDSFAAVLGVRDEVTLIDACINNLRSIGVAHIAVVDTGSTDGTEVILDRLARNGEIELVRAQDVTLDTGYLNDGLAALRAKFDPDWIMVLDADEFWMPLGGSIRDIVRETDEVVFLRRLNGWRPEHPEGWPKSLDDLRATLLFTGQPRTGREIIENSKLKWIRAQEGGKVIARASAVGKLGPAGHEIIGVDGNRVAPRVSNDGLIVHLPFTTFERFEQKVRNIQETIARYPGYFGQAGFHWKRWVTIYEAGGLRQEFDAQQLVDAEVTQLRRQGELVAAAALLDYLHQQEVQG